MRGMPVEPTVEFGDPPVPAGLGWPGSRQNQERLLDSDRAITLLHLCGQDRVNRERRGRHIHVPAALAEADTYAGLLRPLNGATRLAGQIRNSVTRRETRQYVRAIGGAASDEHHQRAHRAQQLSDRAREEAGAERPPPERHERLVDEQTSPASPTFIASRRATPPGPEHYGRAPTSSANTPGTNATPPNRRSWPRSPIRATSPPTVATLAADKRERLADGRDRTADARERLADERDWQRDGRARRLTRRADAGRRGGADMSLAPRPPCAGSKPDSAYRRDGSTTPTPAPSATTPRSNEKSPPPTERPQATNASIARPERHASRAERWSRANRAASAPTAFRGHGADTALDPPTSRNCSFWTDTVAQRPVPAPTRAHRPTVAPRPRAGFPDGSYGRCACSTSMSIALLGPSSSRRCLTASAWSWRRVGSWISPPLGASVTRWMRWWPSASGISSSIFAGSRSWTLQACASQSPRRVGRTRPCG